MKLKERTLQFTCNLLEEKANSYPNGDKREGGRGEAKLARNLLFQGLKFRSSVCVGITSFLLLLVLQWLHP